MHSYSASCVLVGALLALAGCASIPADRGFKAVNEALGKHGQVAVAPTSAADDGATLTTLLAAPLSVETAQRIALSHNPTLLAQLAQLGIAEAAAYDAARISNPRFTLTWLDSNGPGEQITLGLAQNVTELLLLSPRRRLAEGELTRVQQQAAAALMALSAEVEAAWFRHVTALAVRDLREATAAAGALSAEFAQALFKAGNISQLALERERAAAEVLRISALQAQSELAVTRSALSELMGLPADVAWELPRGLPLPVPVEDSLAELQRTAGAGRLDLLAAQGTVGLLEDALGVERSYRWLGQFTVGVEHERDPDGVRLTGPSFEFELPLFNQGQGKVLRAAAGLDAARAAARTLEISVSNTVAQAAAEVATAREVVDRYRTVLIPLREQVVARAREMQNYMLIGQFEVLQDKQAEYATYEAYLSAVGDYWAARSALSRAIGAPLPSAVATTAATLEPSTLIGQPLDTTHESSSHDAHAP